MEITTRWRKRISAIVAGVLVLATLLTGTLAWQNISQEALNEVNGAIDPGGRIHDDFDKGSGNKDVYAENFGDTPLFVRIRLDEYMEIGGTSLINGALKNDLTTWETHIPFGNTVEECEQEFHDYWSWDMGGQKWYIPTFNMDKDSKLADVTGDGIDANGDTNTGKGDGTEEAYKSGDSETDTEIYDHLDSSKDVPSQTHDAAQTLPGTVISMAQWLALPASTKESTAYWVYDADGWAYWSKALLPGEATSLLLDQINLNLDPDDDWYYGINVVGQFATRGDWSGFEDPDNATSQGATISENAKNLINNAANLLPTVRAIQVDNTYSGKLFVKAGSAITLSATVVLTNDTGSPALKNVVWTKAATPTGSSVISGNTFTAGAGDAGKTFTVTATPVADPAGLTASADIVVLPAGAYDITRGADGNAYADYGDNTFKLINTDGTLAEPLFSGGGNKIPGDGDDIRPVIIGSDGTKYLGPNPDGSYNKKGPDGKLGTSDDTRVFFDPANVPDNMNAGTERDTPFVPVTVTEVLITTPPAAGASVEKGGTLQFGATVYNVSPALADNQSVTWTVLDGITGTSISGTGLLTVAAGETASTLRVRATSAENTDVVSNYYTVTVTAPIIPGQPSPITGTPRTVTDPSGTYEEIATSGAYSLILRTTIDMYSEHNHGGVYDGSVLQTGINNWFSDRVGQPSMVVLNNAVGHDAISKPGNQARDIDGSGFSTPTGVPSTGLNTAFLLSTDEAKAFCSVYYYNSAGQGAGSSGQAKTNWEALGDETSHNWWLRSPGLSSTVASTVNGTGFVTNHTLTGSNGLRPALWVKSEIFNP
jgi:hypothetical protein